MEGFGAFILFILVGAWFVGLGIMWDDTVKSKTGPIEPKLEITIQDGIADTTWIYTEPDN